jgi:hypothetical protein
MSRGRFQQGENPSVPKCVVTLAQQARGVTRCTDLCAKAGWSVAIPHPVRPQGLLSGATQEPIVAREIHRCEAGGFGLSNFDRLLREDILQETQCSSIPQRPIRAKVYRQGGTALPTKKLGSGISQKTAGRAYQNIGNRAFD